MPVPVSVPRAREEGAAGAIAARTRATGTGRPRAKREPVHPGYFLDTRYLKPLKLTQLALADALGISRRRVNELIRGRRGVTPDTAVRLAAYFDTEPEFWMQLQMAWDVHHAIKAMKQAPRS